MKKCIGLLKRKTFVIFLLLFFSLIFSSILVSSELVGWIEEAPTSSVPPNIPEICNANKLGNFDYDGDGFLTQTDIEIINLIMKKSAYPQFPDITSDSIFDEKDLNYLIKCRGTEVALEVLDCECPDVNSDGSIDIKDMVTLAKNQAEYKDMLCVGKYFTAETKNLEVCQESTDTFPQTTTSTTHPSVMPENAKRISLENTEIGVTVIESFADGEYDIIYTASKKTEELFGINLGIWPFKESLKKYKLKFIGEQPQLESGYIVNIKDATQVTDNEILIDIRNGIGYEEENSDNMITGSAVKIADKKIRSDKNFVVVRSSTYISTLGVQKIAIILVRSKEVRAKDLPSKEEFKKMIFAKDSAYQRFFKEASYGKIWLEGDVYGWYVSDKIKLSGNSMGYQNSDMAISLADKDIDYRKYDRVVIIVPDHKSTVEGRIGGEATRGATIVKTEDGILRLSTVVVKYDTTRCEWGDVGEKERCDHTYFFSSLLHELGHNFGANHANRVDCKGEQAFIDYRYDTDGLCSSLEYGNYFDVMGSSNSEVFHYQAYFKHLFNWLAIGDGSLISISSPGRYSLRPLEKNNAVAAKVKNDKHERIYYLEYRTPYGFDSGLNNFEPKDGLLINLALTDYMRAGYLLSHTESSSGRKIFFLRNGNEYFDKEAGIKISNVMEDKANEILYFDVDFTEPCISRNPVVADIIYHPGEISYKSQDIIFKEGKVNQIEIRFKNDDSATCKPRTLELKFLDYSNKIKSINYFGEKRTLSPEEEGRVLVDFEMQPIPWIDLKDVYELSFTIADTELRDRGGVNPYMWRYNYIFQYKLEPPLLDIIGSFNIKDTGIPISLKSLGAGGKEYLLFDTDIVLDITFENIGKPVGRSSYIIMLENPNTGNNRPLGGEGLPEIKPFEKFRVEKMIRLERTSLFEYYGENRLVLKINDDKTSHKKVNIFTKDIIIDGIMYSRNCAMLYYQNGKYYDYNDDFEIDNKDWHILRLMLGKSPDILLVQKGKIVDLNSDNIIDDADIKLFDSCPKTGTENTDILKNLNDCYKNDGICIWNCGAETELSFSCGSFIDKTKCCSKKPFN